MVSLVFEGVGKTYPDGTVAVSNVSFEVADGEFVVMVGPSGCGKSTLLRIAAGLEDLSTGKTWLGRDDVSLADPQDRDIAMVFQNYALYPHMSVFQNLAFSLEQRKLSKAEIEAQVQETAALLDLTPLLHRKPGQLSGGQRQRVAMGRAIVRHPAAFLMDEPLSNLDAKLRVQMRGELKILNERLNVTTLYVTHDQVEAMTMGDRVAVLKPVASAQESNLQQIGSPQELYDRPINLFVAGFIGSPAMNFLWARIEDEGERLSATIEGTSIRVPVVDNDALQTYRGKSVILGVRPEVFEVRSADEAVFDAEVLVSEALGADTYVFFDLASPPVDLDAAQAALDLDGPSTNRIVARIPPDRAVPRGQPLNLGIDASKLHWFEPATGEVIRR